MTSVRPSGSTFPVADCDCLRFATTSEASASLVVAKRRPGRGSSLRSGPARIQQCKTALCLDGGRVWDAEVSQVQLNIGLYAKSSYRGFLVAPYDSVARWGADSSLVCTERELFERQVKIQIHFVTRVSTPRARSPRAGLSVGCLHRRQSRRVLVAHV